MNNWPTFCTRLRNHPAAVLGCLAGLTAVLAVASLGLGAVSVAPTEVLRALLSGQSDGVAAQIVLYARLPRTLAGLLAGAALAVAGVLIQTVLANPLAAPHILGVNAGAGLAVTVCCALAPGLAMQPLAAFGGAMAGVLLVLLFAESTGASRITLVLAGKSEAKRS